MNLRVWSTLWISYHKCTNCWSSCHQRSWAHTWRNCHCLATAPVLLSERSEFVVPNSSSNEEGPIADYPLKWNYTLRQLALMLHLVSGVPRETTWDKTRRFVVTSCSKFFKVCVNYSNFCQLYQLASTSSCNVSSSVVMITITLETSCSEVVGWNSGYIILWHAFLLITMRIFYQT